MATFRACLDELVGVFMGSFSAFSSIVGSVSHMQVCTAPHACRAPKPQLRPQAVVPGSLRHLGPRGSDAGTTRSRVHALLTRLCGTLGRVQGDGGQRVAGNRLHHLAPERQPSGPVSEGDPEVCHLGAAYITVNPILERSNLASRLSPFSAN